MKGGRQSVKAVLDTNVFISAIFWTGNPHKIVALAIDKKIEVYVSPEILEELERVLHRDFKEDHEFIERQIALILSYATVIKPSQKVRVVKDDPDDDKIIECALTARADYIVSGDPHLFSLKEVFNILIFKPKDFLEVLAALQ